jgi:hypothetical protein
MACNNNGAYIDIHTARNPLRNRRIIPIKSCAALRHKREQSPVEDLKIYYIESADFPRGGPVRADTFAHKPVKTSAKYAVSSVFHAVLAPQDPS